jgi:hypothetical protein
MKSTLVTLNNLLDSRSDSPHKVQVTEPCNGCLNVGVRYPDLGGYNVPFTAFINTDIDLLLVLKLSAAYYTIARELDPHSKQPRSHVYDYDYATNSSWVIRRDGKSCSTLPNTFWEDEPNWAFNHGGLAWELHTILWEMAENMLSVIEMQQETV